ncbi:MAG: divalent-cation tolerance protein CutA [Candidatus Caenarcaniphilales bacterium]|nr:divalent-cation tolerance protein CutA [Candidatus Caenarcaniphilales bacterium]
MTEFKAVYITCKDKAEAKKIAKSLLKNKLIACANIYDHVSSYYNWKGSIQKDKEAIFICKTKEEFVERIIKVIRDLHSYECPCILVFPIEIGNPEFLTWINQQLNITNN